MITMICYSTLLPETFENSYGKPTPPTSYPSISIHQARWPGHPGAAVRSSKLKPSPSSIPASRNPISMRHRRKPSSCKALPWPFQCGKDFDHLGHRFFGGSFCVIFMWFYICKPVSLFGVHFY